MNLVAKLVSDFQYPDDNRLIRGIWKYSHKAIFYGSEYYGEIFQGVDRTSINEIQKFYREGRGLYVNEYTIREFYNKNRIANKETENFINEGRRLYGELFDEYGYNLYNEGIDPELPVSLYIEIIGIYVNDRIRLHLGNFTISERSPIFIQDKTLIFEVNDFAVFVIDLETKTTKVISIRNYPEAKLLGAHDRSIYVFTTGINNEYNDILEISIDTEEIVRPIRFGPINPYAFCKVFRTQYDLILYSSENKINTLRSLYTGEILLTWEHERNPWISLLTENEPFIISGGGYDIVVFRSGDLFSENIYYTVLGQDNVYVLDFLDGNGEQMDPMIIGHYRINNVYSNNNVVTVVLEQSKYIKIFQMQLPFSRMKKAYTTA